jgi:hypothetical protein
VLLSYCLLRPTVLLWRRRRTSSFIVMRVKHSRHKNTPHLYQKNLPAISHHKSSRHFSPQTFPPFLTTNLPAISHHKPSRHFSPQTFPPFLTSHQPCASSSLPPQKYPALVPHRLSRHKNTPIFCLIVSPRHKNI